MSATDTTAVALQTALQTAEALAPAVLAATATAASITSPNVAIAAQLAPVVAQAIQNAAQLVQAGNMTPAQLAAKCQQLGALIQQLHNEEAALTMPAMPTPA